MSWKYHTGEEHEVLPLSPEQAQHLLHEVRGQRLDTLLALALTTGMRKGEILALRWHDIDLQKGSLQIRRTVKYLAGHGYIEGEPKTAKSRRKITLPDFVVEKLKQHRAMQLETRLQAGAKWVDRNIVFCNTHGGFLAPMILYRLFAKALRDAGLPHIRFHDLRHSAATLLLSMGVHPKVVQKLLGHSSISMTMNTYSHILPSMQKDAMNKMDDLFLDNGEAQ